MSTRTRVIAARVSTVALATCGVSTTFGQAEQALGHVWLCGEDVEAGGDPARDELVDERVLVDDRPAGRVDQGGSVPEQCEPFPRDEALRLRCQRDVQRDDVRRAQKLVER